MQLCIKLLIMFVQESEGRGEADRSIAFDFRAQSVHRTYDGKPRIRRVMMTL